MKQIDAFPDRVILEVTAEELLNLHAASLGYHSDQRHSGTPFGCRLQDIVDGLGEAQDEVGRQLARSRGLVVEGDEPTAGGAF